MSLEEILKSHNNTLYLVYRRHWYANTEDDIAVDVGGYIVERVDCQNEEELKKIIKNFSYLLEDDNGALITVNEEYAYGRMTYFNYRLYEDIDDSCYFSNLQKQEENDFTKFVIGMCESEIENRRRH